MTTARYMTVLLFTAGMIALFPALQIRGNDNAQSDLAREGRNQLGGVAEHKQGTAGTNRETRGNTVRVFRCSAYCAGPCCCPGTADGITASGHRITKADYGRTKADYGRTKADYGRICAAPKSIPFGTKLRIEGVGVVNVQDRGGSIREAGDTVAGKVLRYPRIDLLCSSHNEAREFGVKYLNCEVVLP